MQNTYTNEKSLTTDHMPELKLKQLQYETDTWKRQLDFMMEENIRNKNRLSEILTDRFDKNLLEEVDGFLVRFIKEDELIRLLRDDVAEMERLLKRELFEDGMIIKETGKKLKRLRNNMMFAEDRFAKMKAAFNNFLIQSIL